MGRYDLFVWPAISITALVLVALLVLTLRTLRAREKRLAELEKALGRRSKGDEAKT